MLRELLIIDNFSDMNIICLCSSSSTTTNNNKEEQVTAGNLMTTTTNENNNKQEINNKLIDQKVKTNNKRRIIIPEHIRKKLHQRKKIQQIKIKTERILKDPNNFHDWSIGDFVISKHQKEQQNRLSPTLTQAPIVF
ncbi:hypothetical protein ABK040_001494 [Willaertia magna]